MSKSKNFCMIEDQCFPSHIMVIIKTIGTIKEQLISIKTNQLSGDSINTDFFVASFQEIFASLNDEKAIDDKTRLLLTDTMSVWLLRSRQLLDNKSLDTEFYREFLKETLLQEKNCTFLLCYVIDFWSEGGAALANALADLFKKLTALLRLIHGSASKSIFMGWVNQILAIAPSMRVLYFLLDCLSGEIDMYIVFQKRPSFVEDSLNLMGSESLATPIGKCLTSLLVGTYKLHFKEVSSGDWFSLWESTVICHLDDPKLSRKIENYVLVPIFKSCPSKIFTEFVRRNFNETSHQLIPILKIGQDLSIEEEPFQNDKLVSLSFIEAMLQHETFRLPAFELLTYSPKRSKAIQPYVYELVKRNIHTFFVDIELKVRNDFHSAFKKFVDRIRDSTYALQRDAVKLKSKGKFPNEQNEKLHLIETAREFLCWLILFLKRQLAPGAQYQRKSLSIKILKTLVFSRIDCLIKRKYVDPRQKMDYPFSISVSEDETLFRLLCDNLTDNFNDIRNNSLELLTIFADKSKSLPLFSSAEREYVHSQAMKLLNSYKGSDGGAKVMEFLFIVDNKKQLFVSNLVETLYEKVRFAFETFPESVDVPISGFFAAAAAVLSNFNFEESDQSCNIIKKCIDAVFLNWETVKPVLCEESLASNFSLGDTDHLIFDQVVTSFAFRSIRESANLLSTIFARGPLNKADLTRCGQLLLTQLSSIRHSGAFQSIVPCFSACCQRCSRDVPNQLEVWINEMIVTLKTKTQYITRRSGGLPFLLSAILIAEKAETRPLLNLTFETLLSIVKIPVSEHEERVDLPQVNAFNCIKALFVESELSESCTAFVHPSLELCLHFFASPLWSLRNCAFMLFAALQNRLFGKPGKNISARLFFTRYKGVREVLLRQLRDSLKTTNENMHLIRVSSTSLGSLLQESQIESIFLVLTILSRLKETPGYEGLQEFKDLVLECLEFKTWKIRELAARALPHLCSDPFSEALLLWSDPNFSPQHQNRLHGFLLAVKEVFVIELAKSDKSEIPQHLVDLIVDDLSRLLIKNPCFITSNIYVQLLAMVLKGSEELRSTLRMRKIINSIGHYFISLNNEYCTDGSKQLLMKSLLKILFCYEDPDSVKDLILLCLYSPSFEVQIASAKYIESNIDLDREENVEIFDTLMNLLQDSLLWTHVKHHVVIALQKSTRKCSPSLISILLNQENDAEMEAAALEYLGSVVDNNNNQYWHYIDKHAQDDSSLEIRQSCLTSLMNFYNSNADLKAIFKIIGYLFDDELNLRVTAAKFLNKQFIKLPFFRWNTTFPVTVKIAIRTLISQCSSEEVFDLAMNSLQRNFRELEFVKSIEDQEEIFEVETSNQFRNYIDQGIDSINLLKSEPSRIGEVKNYIQELIAKFILQMERFDTRDAPLGWGSDSKIFARVVLLRASALQFSVPAIDTLDKALHRYKFHPLVFEIMGTLGTSTLENL